MFCESKEIKEGMGLGLLLGPSEKWKKEQKGVRMETRGGCAGKTYIGLKHLFGAKAQMTSLYNIG